jgi:hypothetical protein
MQGCKKHHKAGSKFEARSGRVPGRAFIGAQAAGGHPIHNIDGNPAILGSLIDTGQKGAK